jgi:hypothetical protein
MINENIFRVLRTSAAYFADISATDLHLQRYITYGGLEASEITVKSFHYAQNITEAIPVFTDLDIKDLTNIMVLPKWNYGKGRSKYYTTRLKVQDYLSGKPQIIAQADRSSFGLLQL